MEKVKFFFSVAAVCVGICFSPHVWADRASELGLLPHKALYDIHLVSKKSSSQIAAINGQMAYSWQPDCDAWISNTQFDLTYDYLETPSMKVTSAFSSYEQADGGVMNFSSQRRREGNLFEEYRGVASRDNETGLVKSRFTIPDGLEKNLPEGTLFPIAHTLGVIESIKSGKKFYSAALYDGSDEKGGSLVNTFVGKPVDIAPYIKKDQNGYDNSLLGKKAWKLRLAFFPTEDEQETTADYEMNAIFHETGVISHMTVEYSDFAVEQSLVALEAMESVCGQKSKNTEKGKDNTDKAE